MCYSPSDVLDKRFIPATSANRLPGAGRVKKGSATMTTKFAGAIVTMLVLAGAGLCRAASSDVDAATLARIAQFDKGPSTIDVSKYPLGIQKDYKIFRQKCTVCHTLARPINSDFVLPDEWSRYVKRMMHKPGSMISGADAKKIYTFLVYDASIRKKTALDAKLAGLSAADKAADEAKIKEIRDENDKK
jgi:hypothetical protein